MKTITIAASVFLCLLVVFIYWCGGGDFERGSSLAFCVSMSFAASLFPQLLWVAYWLEGKRP